jgi:hypothetical protein
MSRRLRHGNEEYIGATGFEPATSWSQTRRSTKLSYAPKDGGMFGRKNETARHFLPSGMRSCDELVHGGQTMKLQNPLLIAFAAAMAMTLAAAANPREMAVARDAHGNYRAYYAPVRFW